MILNTRKKLIQPDVLFNPGIRRQRPPIHVAIELFWHTNSVNLHENRYCTSGRYRLDFFISSDNKEPIKFFNIIITDKEER